MIKVPATMEAPTLLPSELEAVKDYDHLRKADIVSIRRYVEAHQDKLTGRVLDFGCGRPGTCRQPEPFRDLVKGEYIGIDKDDPLPREAFDAVLCTQVTQYLDGFTDILFWWRTILHVRRGHLILTYGTNWPEVEPEDHIRYTKSGMERLVMRAGFRILDHQPRAALVASPNIFITGHGLTAVVEE